MAIGIPFADRFSYPSSEGVSPTISTVAAQSLSDTELEAASSELKLMAEMVRSKSVLLKNKTTLEIFNIITRDADPQIGQFLSTARDKNTNQLLFQGEESIKEIMFADPFRPAATQLPNRNLLAHGIRTISVDITASILIGQLSQIGEQAAHAERLYALAYKRLEEIALTYEIPNNSSVSNSNSRDEEAPIAFFFEIAELEIPENKEILVEWYSPNLSPEWQVVNIYSGNTETGNIVSDLVDSINVATINLNDTIQAVAELSSLYGQNPARPVSAQYHAIRFYPRYPVSGVIAHSINVRIRVQGIAEDTDPYINGKTPFVWGRYIDSLNIYPVNGTIVVSYFNRISTAGYNNQLYDPSVIYIRNKYLYLSEGEERPSYALGRLLSYDVPPSEAILRFRVQPFHPKLQLEVDPIEFEATIQRNPSKDNERYSECAVAISNILADKNIETYLVGAIIRNDDYTMTSPMAAIELNAWSARAFMNITLDVLEIPEDIEIAVGGRYQIRSSFSNKPKSIFITNEMANPALQGIPSLTKQDHLLVENQKLGSKLWRTLVDEEDAMNAGLPKHSNGISSSRYFPGWFN